MRIAVNAVDPAEAGDYYQVVFGASGETGDPYVLIQCQFEDPDDDLFYIETHDESYCGHARVRAAVLRRDGFVLELRRPRAPRIEIDFSIPASEHVELRRILTIMIPDLVVEGVG